MATMRWQNISLPIAQGIDTKPDSKALQPGKLANLENGVFTKAGSVIKRNGYEELSNEIVNATAHPTLPIAASPTSIKGLHTKGGELLLADDERLLSYVSVTDEWRDRGRFKSVHISTETIADSNDKQVLGDCATLAGVTVYAWEHNGGVYMQVVNEDTGAVYFRPVSVDAAGIRPKVIAVGTSIHVYYMGDGDPAGTLKRMIIAPSNLAILDTIGPSFDIVVNDLDGICLYDVCTDNTNVYIAYYADHATNKLTVIKQAAGGRSIKDASFVQTPSSAISICLEPNTGVISVTWANASEGVKQMFLHGTTLNTKALGVSVLADASVATADVENIASAFRRDQQARAKLYALELESDVLQFAEYTDGTTRDALALYGSMTIEAWIRFESLPSGTNKYTLVSRDENDTGTKGYYFRFVSAVTDILQFGYRTSGGVYVQASEDWNNPTLNTWYHIAVSHDRAAGTVTMFVDGESIGSTTGLDATLGINSAADFRIGSENDTHPNYFDGMISEVRVWDEARTATEVSTNRFVEFAGGNVPNALVGYWRLNNSYEDSSGNEITLTPDAGLVSTIVFRDAIASGFDTTLIALPAETEIVGTDYPLVVFYEVDKGADYNSEVHRVQISPGGTVYAASLFRKHSGIASRAWANQNDVHVNLVHDSLLQTTYFTYLDDNITMNGTLIAKMEQGVARGLAVESHLPNVQDLGNSVYQWVGGFRKRLDTFTGSVAATTASVNALYEAPGLKRFKMDFASPQAHEMVQVGRTGYFAGGQLWQYDGSQIVEAGFHVYPENFTAAITTGTGLAAGDYYYKVYACWINANGEKERSACAAPIKVGVGVAPNRDVRLTIQTIAHTNKHPRRGIGSHIHFEIYRTEVNPAGDAPFYKVSGDDPSDVSGDNCFVKNTFATDTITFDDSIADLALVAGEVDYEFSGELANIPPPAPLIIGEGKDRIFLAGFEDTSEIVYSKQHFAGGPVDFNDTLRLTIPEDGGAITGLRVMNNNLVIFKEESIYVLPGDGPNNLGFGQFGAAQLVVNDVGCVNQRTLVDVPSGIMFQSKKGIYTLMKQYRTVYTGAPVEQYNSQLITDGVLAADKNHVLFVADGRALMYDYLFDQWSTFTNHEGTAATSWNDTICYGRNDARIFRESASTKRDAGSRVVLRLETAWVKLNTLQGFQRVRRAMVLGEFRSNHRLALDIAYDYEPLRKRLVFDATSLIGTSTFGDPLLEVDNTPAEFGDGDPFGSGTAASGFESRVYQFRAHLPIQKCQSVKFYFEDMHTIGEYLGEGYEITELMLEVGTKRGTFKTADTRSI